MLHCDVMDVRYSQSGFFTVTVHTFDRRTILMSSTESATRHLPLVACPHTLTLKPSTWIFPFPFFVHFCFSSSVSSGGNGVQSVISAFRLWSVFSRSSFNLVFVFAPTGDMASHPFHSIPSTSFPFASPVTLLPAVFVSCTIRRESRRKAPPKLTPSDWPWTDCLPFMSILTLLLDILLLHPMHHFLSHHLHI